MPLLTKGKTNWKPRTNSFGIIRGKYILIVLILAVLVGGGIFGYIKIPQILKGWSCDKLEKLRSAELNKLDFSCETDSDCTFAAGVCTPICVNINTDTKKYEEILNTMRKKGCLPVCEILPTECKCINNKCEGQVLTFSEATVTSPSKGEIWIIGETYQINWTPSDPTKTVDIMLLNEHGTKVWQVKNIPDTGNYSFTVPEVSPGDAYKIYIESREKFYEFVVKSGYSELFSIIFKIVRGEKIIIREEETADWRIYRAGAPGYESEIKYPKDWMIHLTGPILYFKPETPRLPEDVIITIGIQLLQPGAFSPYDFFKKEIYIKEVYINDSKWYCVDRRFYHEDLKTAFTTRTCISPNSDGSKVVTLQLSINGGRQTKDYYLGDTEIKNELKILNQMASTFKFLEKIETPMICPQGFIRKHITHPWRTENNEVVCLENMGGAICVKCGNGICEKDEDWCICPEDCPKPNPEDLEFRKIY